MATAVSPGGSPAEPERIKVVIVGAGVAGLGAAVKLVSARSPKCCPAGFEVRVLEASERSGGRCCTVDVEGVPVETGATYFHGSSGNAMLDLGKKCGVAYRAVTEKDEAVYCTDHGSLRPDELALYNKSTSLLESIEDALDSKEWRGKRGDEYEYLTTAFDAKYSRLLKRPYDTSEHEGLVRGALRYWLLFTGMSEGVLDCHGVDISAYNIYDELKGEELSRCKDGSSMGQIVAAMEKIVTTSERGSVHFGSRVSRVQWSSEEQPSRFNGHRALVECANGERFEADHVIVTLSLGALKMCVSKDPDDAGSFFVPELPLQKAEAIGSIGFGLLNKVILRFDDEAIVKQKKPTLIFIWSKDSTLAKLSETFPWMPSFCALERIGASNLYESYFAGEHASLVASADDEQLAKGFQAALALFLQKPDLTPPVVVFKSNWEGEPHFGCYSYNSLETFAAHRKTLLEPLCSGGSSKLAKPVVLFAGEATHPSRWASLDGALETGRREADRITAFWTKAKPPLS